MREPINELALWDVRDANYTWTDDPFGPEYEIVDIKIFHNGLLMDPKVVKHHLVLDRTLFNE